MKEGRSLDWHVSQFFCALDGPKDYPILCYLLCIITYVIQLQNKLETALLIFYVMYRDF